MGLISAHLTGKFQKYNIKFRTLREILEEMKGGSFKNTILSLEPFLCLEEIYNYLGFKNTILSLEHGFFIREGFL